MRRYRVFLVVLAVLIAGCSALRLGYTQADIILAWRANSYFDFDSAQRRDFSARLERLLAWHRVDQLPEYASFLTAARDKAEHGLKAEDIEWFAEGLRARYRTIIYRGASDAADILATLAPEQIVAVQKQFDKDNRKFVAEYELESGSEKRKRARLKKMIGQIEDWTGSLTREQERKVAALLDPIPHIEHLRHQDRMRRQREFVELLKMRGTKPEFAIRLRQWLPDWERGRTPEYARLADEVFDQRVQFLVAVDQLLTRDQHQRALTRLQKFADDCKTLSARPPARAGDDRAGTAILALF
jgi:hypothetical protein